jgi:hypothetical protein
MANPGKDTIYIDVDDEITAVIDKVVNAKHKVVAVVLPKRATVFQSPVNMKLLKKAAISVKKNIVLITSDTSIIAIAGSVGLHVAKSPTSKPIIPKAAVTAVAANEVLEVDGPDTESDSAINTDDTIELDNTDSTDKESETKDTKKKKKVGKIPDFSSFRLRLGLGIGLLVALIVLWYVGFVVMPQATVTVKTDVTTENVSTTITAQVGESELNLENNTIPAKRVQVEKIDTVTVPATGEKNVGSKATGKINLTNCIKSDGVQVVPAGTRFSGSGFTFETTEQAILPEATFNFSGDCKSKDIGDDLTVGAVALEPGENSNIGAQTLNSSISGIFAVGSAMTGGTTQIIKVVSQDDVNKATEQLSGASKNQSLSELQQQLRDDGKRPIDETLVTSKATVVASPAVGAEATETKVTMTVNYSLIGVKEDELVQIIEKEARKLQGDTPINIRDSGIGGVIFTVAGTPNEADTKINIQSVATIGPDINTDELKKSLAGKKRGDIEKQIEAIEGVRSVSVEYSPFWITTTPKSAEKITIVFVEDDGTN